MDKRAFTAPPESARCTSNVTLRDGSGAACMHRRVSGTDRCWQHQRVYECPFCEHMPDGAQVRLCAKHACKACETRYQAGLPGMCPSCANERSPRTSPPGQETVVTDQRPFTTLPESERCTGNIILAMEAVRPACLDGSPEPTAAGSIKRVHECPFCEHMPDDAKVRLCAKHACKACEARHRAGLPGMCPSCASERTRNESARRAKDPP